MSEPAFTDPGLSEAQATAVANLNEVLGEFALALERCREADMRIVDAFRAAGIPIPAYVPDALLENLLVPS